MRSRPAARLGLSAVILAAFVAACGSTPASTSTPSSAAAAAASAAPASAAPIALYACGPRTLAWDGKAAVDLTGTWNADDEGVYYLRQLGDQVWWLGMSGLGRPLALRGSDWTNVYAGTLSGDTITGTYADVPQGNILDNGPVVLRLTATSGGGISLVRTDPVLETGFGGTLMTPCTLG